MSDDDAIPQGSYTVRGKQRIQLWKHDVTDLAKDSGEHSAVLRPLALVCMRVTCHCWSTLVCPYSTGNACDPPNLQGFWRSTLQR